MKYAIDPDPNGPTVIDVGPNTHIIVPPGVRISTRGPGPRSVVNGGSNLTRILVYPDGAPMRGPGFRRVRRR